MEWLMMAKNEHSRQGYKNDGWYIFLCLFRFIRFIASDISLRLIYKLDSIINLQLVSN